MLEEERDRQSDSVGVETDDGESVSPESSGEPQEENEGAEIKEGPFPKKKVAIISACLAAVVVIGQLSRSSPSLRMNTAEEWNAWVREIIKKQRIVFRSRTETMRVTIFHIAMQ